MPHIHALQHADGIMGYWLADLGSTNGTLRNGKRGDDPLPAERRRHCHHRLRRTSPFAPTRPRRGRTNSFSTDSPATVVVRSSQLCWLVMMDIKKYTVLARELDIDTLSLKVGTWLRQCRDAIEGNGNGGRQISRRRDLRLLEARAQCARASGQGPSPTDRTPAHP